MMNTFSTEIDKQHEIRGEINKRWEALGFTEGLSGHCKETMAKLFESEPSVKITDVTAEDLPIVRHIADRINFDIKEKK